MTRRTLADTVTVSGIGPQSGAPCVATLAPAEYGAGLSFTTAEDTIVAGDATLEGTDTLTVFGEASEVGSVEALLAACFLAGITDLVVTVEGDELPEHPVATWLSHLAATADGPPHPTCAVTEAAFVSGDSGFAALVPGEPSVAVRLDAGPGRTGEGVLPLDLALLTAELATARRVRLDLSAAQAHGDWLGLGPHNCATSLDALQSPDEGLRWHMLCALAVLALTDSRGRLEVDGPDLEPLARLLAVL